MFTHLYTESAITNLFNDRADSPVVLNALDAHRILYVLAVDFLHRLHESSMPVQPGGLFTGQKEDGAAKNQNNIRLICISLTL